METNVAETAADSPEVPVEVTIDEEPVTVERNRPLIEVIREHGPYIPGWCHHPNMRPATELEPAELVYRPIEGAVTTPPGGVSALDDVECAGDAIHGETSPYDGCDTCVVEVDGEVVRACETRAASDLVIRTDTEAVQYRRQAAMGELFKHHPHACLDCPQKEGCDRISCSMGVPPEARCCDLLGNCELEKSAEAIDLDWGEVPPYDPLDRPGQTTSVFDINWELCIGCNRCVGVCEDHVGAGVWEFTHEDDAEAGTDITVGLKAETLAKAGCKYCTACVEACPTGTLMDNDGAEVDRDRLPLEFRDSLSDVPFPDSRLELTLDTVKREVPNAGGVYTLYDETGEVLAINGVADLSAELLQEVETGEAVEFDIDLDENFTTRETEMIEQYVNEQGHMPGAGGAMDDLF
ncbi:MAG: 4Fe-4S dicluster domain-containing protein [Halobacteriales archaeon]